jgi:MFS family permease
MHARSTALARKTAWLLGGMAGLLVAGIIALVFHAVAVFAVFMILMVVCGIAAIVVAVIAYSKLKVEQAALMRDEMAYRRQRSGGTD